MQRYNFFLNCPNFSQQNSTYFTKNQEKSQFSQINFWKLTRNIHLLIFTPTIYSQTVQNFKEKHTLPEHNPPPTTQYPHLHTQKYRK